MPRALPRGTARFSGRETANGGVYDMRNGAHPPCDPELARVTNLEAGSMCRVAIATLIGNRVIDRTSERPKPSTRIPKGLSRVRLNMWAGRRSRGNDDQCCWRRCAGAARRRCPRWSVARPNRSFRPSADRERVGTRPRRAPIPVERPYALGTASSRAAPGRRGRFQLGGTSRPEKRSPWPDCPTGRPAANPPSQGGRRHRQPALHRHTPGVGLMSNHGLY